VLGRKANGARVGTEVLQPNRLRLLDECPEQAVTLGQVPDARCELLVDAHVDELLEVTVWRDDAERAVLRVNEIDGRLDNPSQHCGEIDEFTERPIGLQQAAQPSLGEKNLVRLRDQIGDSDIEPPAWAVRKRERTLSIRHSNRLPA
jgi:hypothetical protein